MFVLSIRHHNKSYDFENNNKLSKYQKKMQQKFEKKVSEPFKP